VRTPSRARPAPAAAFALALALVATAAGLLVAKTAGAATNCTRSPHLTGSFIQSWLPDGWTTADWNSELTTLRNACITQQVLQTTADSGAGTAVYPSGIFTQNTSTDVVDTELAAAGNNSIKVFVGLQFNDQWEENDPATGVPYATETSWLNHQRDIAISLADDLWADYGGYSTFAGWYIPFEADNARFTTQTSWNRLASFYGAIANHLHAISNKPVAVAPFYNTHLGLTSSQWQQMWTSILSQAAIDIVSLQDGVGAGSPQAHATTAQLPTWFSATKNAISAGRPSSKLYSDNETFNERTGGALAISTVVADMKAVQPYVSGFWSFSYDHYDSPKQGFSSQNTSYLKYLNTGTP
jgi:Domain of unknown function (DUF4434)/Domain of unknown function (DUF5109)